MEVAMELEDDLFFADLSRQISLIIMDDDDDEDPVTNYPSVSFQEFSSVQYPIAAAPSPYMLEQAYRRESKGTGVFIPSSSQPRRKKKKKQSSSRYNSNSTSTITTRSQYRKTNGDTRVADSRASYLYSFNPPERLNN